MFGRMKDPVEGTAQLVSYQLTNTGNEFDAVIQAQVVVKAEGLEPTAVEVVRGVPHGELPLAPGKVWRVRVDRKKPKRMKFLDDPGDDGDTAAADGMVEAERLAAQMRSRPDG